MLSRFLTLAGVDATAMFVTFPRHAPAQSTNWQVDAGFVFLNRDGGTAAPLAVTNLQVCIVDGSRLETGSYAGFKIETLSVRLYQPECGLPVVVGGRRRQVERPNGCAGNWANHSGISRDQRLDYHGAAANVTFIH